MFYLSMSWKVNNKARLKGGLCKMIVIINAIILYSVKREKKWAVIFSLIFCNNMHVIGNTHA